MSNIIVITTSTEETVVIKAEQITGLVYSRDVTRGTRETIKVLRGDAPALELPQKTQLGEAIATWQCALIGIDQCFWLGDTKHQEKYRKACKDLGYFIKEDRK